MDFTSFSGFLNHVATGTGFIWNLLVHAFWLVFYHLPQILWFFLVSIVKFVIYLPVFIYKVVVWIFTFIQNTLAFFHDYIFVREWSFADLGTFPSVRPSTLSETLTGGIDEPFARFAGDISIQIKAAVAPLTSAMEWIALQLNAIPWVFLFPAIVALVWVTSKSRGVVMLAIGGLVYIGFFGLSEPAWQTVGLMVVSIILCVVVGVPLGILMSFSNLFERMIKPILDIMQTMPAFVYLIPVLIVFGVSEVAGLIAVAIYAMPPVIRLTNLGIRLVAFDVIEAANAFGATYRQRLTGVLIPLALPNIFAGINQTIMMALAMVVIAALVGADGLGRLVLSAQSNTQLGRGLLYGFGIVVIAIVIDRTFHAIGERMQEHRTVGH